MIINLIDKNINAKVIIRKDDVSFYYLDDEREIPFISQTKSHFISKLCRNSYKIVKLSNNDEIKQIIIMIFN